MCFIFKPRYILSKKDYVKFRDTVKKIAKINSNPINDEELIFKDELIASDLNSYIVDVQEENKNSMISIEQHKIDLEQSRIPLEEENDPAS